MTREEMINFLEMKMDAEPENEDIYAVVIKAMEMFPDNVTNGDVLKKLFPNSAVNSHLSDFGANGIDMRIGIGTHECFMLWFPTDWWNAPYDGGEVKL